ncbi:MAG: PIG-L family deacetylase [Planctomycetota bacterium]
MSDNRFFSPEPPPQVLQDPPKGRVLCFAPHPDDETFSLGGTLHKHVRQGDAVHVVFVTSGISGDPDGHYDAATYAEVRQSEARAALAELGVQEPEFWGFPDGTEVRQEDVDLVAPRLAGLVDQHEADIVYVPWPRDAHSDHWVVSKIAQIAAPQVKRSVRLIGYEGWSACVPTHVVDVTDVYDTKLAACEKYVSQLKYVDYIRLVKGLNTYRSLFLEKGGLYGEAFVELD